MEDNATNVEKGTLLIHHEILATHVSDCTVCNEYNTPCNSGGNEPLSSNLAARTGLAMNAGAVSGLLRHTCLKVLVGSAIQLQQCLLHFHCSF